MKFSNFFTFTLATLATLVVASPIEKTIPLGSPSGIATREVNDLDTTAGNIVTDVEKLVSTIVNDVEAIAAAAGINVSTILATADLSLSKRTEIEIESGDSKRDLQGIEAAVTKLITDILADLTTLSADAGINLVGTILSCLNL